MGVVEIVAYVNVKGARRMCFFDPPATRQEARQWVEDDIERSVPDAIRCWEALGYPVRRSR